MKITHTSPGRVTTDQLLTAECLECGDTFRALTGPDTRVDHRCSTSVVGPVWTVVQLAPTRLRGPHKVSAA